MGRLGEDWPSKAPPESLWWTATRERAELKMALVGSPGAAMWWEIWWAGARILRISGLLSSRRSRAMTVYNKIAGSVDDTCRYL